MIKFIKKAGLLGLVLGAASVVNAQKFNIEWTSKFDNKADVYSVANYDGSLILGSSEGRASMLDKDGKIIWGGKFKELSTNGVKEGNYQVIMWDAGVFFVFDKKMGKDKISCFDTKTGRELWNSDKYQGVNSEGMYYVPELDGFLLTTNESAGLKLAEKTNLRLVDARTGEEKWKTSGFKGYVGIHMYLSDNKELILINLPEKGLSALIKGFRSQLVRLNAQTGEFIWESKVVGMVEKKIVTREPLVSLSRVGNRIYVSLSGFQAFDFATGAPIWSIAYDESLNKGNGKAYYGAFADPLITNDAVYLVTGGWSAGAKFISKYDIESGKELWKSEKISSAKAIPAIDLVNGKIVVQIGGLVNMQQVITRTTTDGSGNVTTTTQYISKYEFLGNFGLRALDEKAGTELWKSEKFDKRISNLVFEGSTVFAASANTLYAYDVNTGNQLFEAKHDKGVGKPRSLFDYKDNIIVICDNGLASYKKKDGTGNYTTNKFKKMTHSFQQGDNYFLQSEIKKTNKIAGVNLETGQIKGIVIAKGSKGGGGGFGNGIDITEDGEHVFMFKKNVATKYKVN